MLLESKGDVADIHEKPPLVEYAIFPKFPTATYSRDAEEVTEFTFEVPKVESVV